jgi:6,7-dimethyl-8-ribityllumazine synthase
MSLAITMIEYQEQTNGAGMRFAVVASRYNDTVTSRLVSGAVDCLREQGVAEDEIEVIWCPGALEVPALAARVAARRDKPVHGIICVGCVVKGETDHYEHVSRESVGGVCRLALEARVAIGNAVLTVQTMQQALARSATGPSNKGWEAARAALIMANHFRAFPLNPA